MNRIKKITKNINETFANCFIKAILKVNLLASFKWNMN